MYLLNKYKIAVVISCAIVFFCFSVPFRLLFSLFTLTEIRPAGALTPIFGLLFGHYGAIAATVGNLAADIVSGYPIWICITGIPLQFLYGYVPFRLWYSFFPSTDTPVPINTVSTIIKYVIVCFFSVLMMSLFLNLLLCADGLHEEAGETAFFAFFNNSVFCVIFGIPLLLWAQRLNLAYFMPQKKSTHPTIPAVFITLFLCTGLLFVLLDHFVVFKNENAVAGVFFILMITLVFLAIIVFSTDAKKEYHCERKKTFLLTEQIIIFFLTIGITSVIISAATSFYDNFMFAEPAALWDDLFFTACISVYVLFALILVILRFVERTVTLPVETLSAIMVEFAESAHTDEESKRITDACEKVICVNGEIRLLKNALTHTISEVQNYTKTLEQITAERERLGAELEIASQIQLSCLPQKTTVLNDDSPFDLSCYILPAREVGGDFYDFFFIDSTRLAILIADVSGKGVPAALFMMHAKTLIKEYLNFGLTPGEAFNRVNEQLLLGNETGMFVTVFLAVIDTQTGTCVCVNAGHNPPLLRKNGVFEFFSGKTACMLAGFEESIYAEDIVHLNPDDAFFLYTDGITEALNAEGAFFGEERLFEALRTESQSAEDLIVQVQKAVEGFVGQEERSDDITMLSFVYQPSCKQSTFLPSRRS